jgi:uncharacterized peroxidase-related enzyme
MQRLNPIDPADATGKTKDLFSAIQQKLGMVPAMMRTMGNSPAVLGGYLQLNATLAEGQLGPKLGELIALAVANANSCEYCNAAHSFIGEKLVHIDLVAIADAREAKSADPTIRAALDFARTLVAKKGIVTDADVSNLKEAGFDDGKVAEIIAHVALNIFTNYFNNAAKVTVDFPQVGLVKTAAI